MNTEATKNNMGGFTLVELMITVFLGAIAVVAIYRGYTAFSQSADAQEQIIEMQQNLRIGMYRLEKDLRRAGMNEENDDSAGSGFVTADSSFVWIRMDLGGTNRTTPLEMTDLTENDEGDGDVDDIGEQISYGIKDPDADGIFGLYRNDENLSLSGTGVEIISNLDALDFVYLAESGSVATVPGNIRSVQVSMVVRTSNEDYRYTNNESYENIQPLPAGPYEIFKADGDNFRRRLLTKQIKIRNAGL